MFLLTIYQVLDDNAKNQLSGLPAVHIKLDLDKFRKYNNKT